MATIKVNGKDQQYELPLTLIELIKKNNVAQPEMVSVQLNGEFLLSEKFGTTQLKDGDEIEFLYFMGGGSRC